MQVYIGAFKHPKPSDQTDLKERRRCNPSGGGEWTQRGGAARWGPQFDWPNSGSASPTCHGHVACFGDLSSEVFWSLVDSSHIGTVMDKRDFF